MSGWVGADVWPISPACFSWRRLWCFSDHSLVIRILALDSAFSPRHSSRFWLSFGAYEGDELATLKAEELPGLAITFCSNLTSQESP